MELAQKHVPQENNKEVDHVIHPHQGMVGRIVLHWENRKKQDHAIPTRAQVFYSHYHSMIPIIFLYRTILNIKRKTNGCESK